MFIEHGYKIDVQLYIIIISYALLLTLEAADFII